MRTSNIIDYYRRLTGTYGKDAARYVIDTFQKRANIDDVIGLIITFFPCNNPCAKLVEECGAMSKRMIDMSSFDIHYFPTCIFEGIRDGLFDPDHPHPADIWLQHNPTVIEHFVGCKHLVRSVDYRLDGAFGSKGRKGRIVGGSGGGSGGGTSSIAGKGDDIVGAIYKETRDAIRDSREWCAKRPGAPNAYGF